MFSAGANVVMFHRQQAAFCRQVVFRLSFQVLNSQNMVVQTLMVDVSLMTHISVLSFLFHSMQYITPPHISYSIADILLCSFIWLMRLKGLRYQQLCFTDDKTSQRRQNICTMLDQCRRHWADFCTNVLCLLGWFLYAINFAKPSDSPLFTFMCCRVFRKNVYQIFVSRLNDLHIHSYIDDGDCF